MFHSLGIRCLMGMAWRMLPTPATSGCSDQSSMVTSSIGIGIAAVWALWPATHVALTLFSEWLLLCGVFMVFLCFLASLTLTYMPFSIVLLQDLASAS